MAKSASDLTTAELPVPHSRQRMGGARLSACARAPEPLLPAVPPDPGRGQPSPSHGPAGTAKQDLCWARPQQASGELRLQGGCSSKMASHFTQDRDGKEGTKMSWAPTFFSLLTYPQYLK